MVSQKVLHADLAVTGFDPHPAAGKYITLAAYLQRIVSLPCDLCLPQAVSVRADTCIRRLVAHCKCIVPRRRDHAVQAPLSVVILPVRDALCPSVRAVLLTTSFKGQDRESHPLRTAESMGMLRGQLKGLEQVSMVCAPPRHHHPPPAHRP